MVKAQKTKCFEDFVIIDSSVFVVSFIENAGSID